MSAVIILLLFIIFYTYFGYILLVVLLGQFIKKEVTKKDIEPKVALLIAAFNEEQDIADKIENSLKLDYPRDKLRIIVVSDGSTDNTDLIVKSYSNRGVELIRVEGRVGKTEARNMAIDQIDDEIVLFSDGTTDYDVNVVRKLVRNFADPKVGMVTGQLIYKDPTNTQIGAAQKLYWKYETLIKEAQTNLGTLTGSIGCITAFRRSAYSHLPNNIIEDFTGPLMFIQKGLRVVYESEAKCYELTTNKTKNEWSMRVRVIRGGMTGMLYARSILNPMQYPAASFQLISHKILRWMIPLFGIMLFLTSILAIVIDADNTFAVIVLTLQVVFYLMALLALLLDKMGNHNKFLGIPLYFVVLNAASLLAFIKTITSSLEATWDPQR